MTKTSDLIVQCFEEEGVTHVFGLPGEENLDLLDSIARSDSIQFVLTRHEQGAGFMAATYGRLTGKAGVAMATLGPGAANILTSTAYATLGGMPVLVITGQKPIKKSRQGRFQMIDVVEMMGPVTKFTHQLQSSDAIPARIREAFRQAQSEMPGAAHLELPEDIAAEDADGTPLPAEATRRPVADTVAIAAAADRIRAAKAPVLVIGGGANRNRACEELTRFVDATGIPFVSTQLGKGVIDERHERFLGCAALSSGDFVHRAIDAADLILAVGHDVAEKPPFVMEQGGAEVIHIASTPAVMDAIYFPQLELVGDLASSARALCEAIATPPGWNFGPMLAATQALADHSAKLMDDDRFPLCLPHVTKLVRAAMPPEGIIALDNGLYKIWFARNYPAYGANRVLLDNALASMGAGLPSAMAAAMLEPAGHVMAICGDGGFLMNGQELETAVRLKLNLTIMILSDEGYGMIRWKQEHMGLKDFGLGFDNPDWVMFAQAHGAAGYRAESSEHLAELLDRCLGTDGVHVIDCPVDYSQDDRILNEDIQRLSKAL